MRIAVADRAWLAALVEVETALARAEAAAGVIPTDVAHAIVAACAGFEADITELSTAAAASGNPVVSLVRRLRAAVPDHVAEFVHKGATSQDIVDSAAMLVAHRALHPLLTDLRAAGDAAATLARRHRDTPMAGRTLLRQAVPTTFGLKAAGWMVALDEAVGRLRTVRSTRLSAQFGGAAGTLAGVAGAGPEVARRLAEELGLTEAGLPWHTNRTRPAELAGALGEAAGVVAKVARDVTLLAQDEVAEVAEGSPGGSSTMAHKRNPVAAVSAAAGAAQAPGLVATMLAAMAHEHERAAGAWHAEWRPLRELLICTGSAAAWLRDCLEHLEVYPEAMRANLDRLLRVLGTSTPDLGSAGTLVDRALAVRE
ncbi:MAG: 3-carboxy-cis,cis-muconate cycloisomerase [Micromonosporaceae bacterium]|nr:3-carboxy-cis,cis-muconate cycloisomerase [Micromonosporaceae bacterium]